MSISLLPENYRQKEKEIKETTENASRPEAATEKVSPKTDTVLKKTVFVPAVAPTRSPLDAAKIARPEQTVELPSEPRMSFPWVKVVALVLLLAGMAGADYYLFMHGRGIEAEIAATEKAGSALAETIKDLHLRQQSAATVSADLTQLRQVSTADSALIESLVWLADNHSGLLWSENSLLLEENILKLKGSGEYAALASWSELAAERPFFAKIEFDEKTKVALDENRRETKGGAVEYPATVVEFEVFITLKDYVRE